MEFCFARLSPQHSPRNHPPPTCAWPKHTMLNCASPSPLAAVRHAIGFVLGLMSRYHLRDLCQLFMNKMATIKPHDPTYLSTNEPWYRCLSQSMLDIYWYNNISNSCMVQKHFDFGVRTVPQINTTILFMTYCRQLMLKARGHSLRFVVLSHVPEACTAAQALVHLCRLEICNTLNHIFKHLMSQAEAWQEFPLMPELHEQFWTLYTGTFPYAPSVLENRLNEAETFTLLL